MRKIMNYAIATIAVLILLFLLSHVRHGLIITPVERLQLTLKDTATLGQVVQQTSGVEILDVEKNLIRISASADFHRVQAQLVMNRDVLSYATLPELPGFSWTNFGESLAHSLNNYAHGDLGNIIGARSGKAWPISGELGPMLERSASYFAASLGTAILIGLGVALAATAFKPLGRILDPIHRMLLALPDFLFTALIILLLIYLSKFTTERLLLVSQIGEDVPFLIPFLTCTLLPGLMIYGTVRQAFLRELTKPYIVTALAKGMTRKQSVLNHALRNVMEDFVTILPRATTAAVGSMIVVETLCSITGIGGYITHPFYQSDGVLPIACFFLASFAILMQFIYALMRKWLVVSTREELA